MDTPDLGKLRWRCRRGMKELDVLLSRYVDEDYQRAPPAHQAAFQELLEAQDPLIYAYCFGYETPPSPHLTSVIDRIIRNSSEPRG